MRRGIMLLLVLGGVLAAGCHAFEDTTGPQGKMQAGARPRHDLTNNCNMEQWKCDEIRAGIDYLLNHANVSCRDAGQAALDRFNAPASSGMGYQEAAQVSGYDMGVNMQTGSSVSGWVPSDGYVNVYGSFWKSGYTDPQDTGHYSRTKSSIRTATTALGTIPESRTHIRHPA